MCNNKRGRVWLHWTHSRTRHKQNNEPAGYTQLDKLNNYQVFQNISYVTEFSPTASWREWLTNGKNNGTNRSKRNCHCWTLVFRTRRNYENTVKIWRHPIQISVRRSSRLPPSTSTYSRLSFYGMQRKWRSSRILKQPTAIYDVFCLLTKGDICQANTPSPTIRYND